MPSLFRALDSDRANNQQQPATNGHTPASLSRPEVRRHVDPFLTVEQAIRNHTAQLVEKLTGLLASRIASRLGAWQPRPPTPSAELRAVCQAMSKLTDTTSDVLSPDMLTVRG